MATATIEERLEKLEAKVGVDRKTTHILVIQDRSGSMSDRVEETISGFNEYVGTLAKDDSDDAYLTLIQFDTRYEVKEENTPIAKVSDLNEDTYIPRGMTALLDAVGRGINDLKREMKKGDRALVVIMTDGCENSSHEFNRRQIADLIHKCEDEGNWSFIYLGAGQDSWSGGELLGLNREKSVFYGKGGAAHTAMFRGLATTSGRYRGDDSLMMANIGTLTSEAMAKEGADVQLENNTSANTEEEAGAGG